MAIREKLAFSPDQLPDALNGLLAVPGVDGCAILSTCNRTEIYTSGGQRSTAAAVEWLHEWHGIPPGRYREYLYFLDQTPAIIHLFKVTAGMDSMVLGEPQVTGQVKRAWQVAAEGNALEGRLDRLFQHAFATAKRVRNETAVGRDPVTLPFAALRLARQIFGEVTTLHALMIGAGEMIEECATHFHDQSLASLTIANRSPERARELAGRFGAGHLALDRVPESLADHDLVIASTGSTRPVLTADMFRQAVARRRHKPVFVLDLAVPRNVDPAVAELGDVYLYTIDDLRAIVESGQKKRSASLPEANRIIDAEATAFQRWLNLQASSDTLKSLRRRAAAERDRLLAQARAELAAGRDPEAVINRLGHRLSNRLLHQPSVRLRQAGEAADEDLLAAARYYFLGDDS